MIGAVSCTGDRPAKLVILMRYLGQRNVFKFFSVVATLLCLTYTVYGQSPQPARSEATAQSLESSLEQKATFTPEGMSVLDQLIAVAKHYQIPMSVE